MCFMFQFDMSKWVNQLFIQHSQRHDRRITLISDTALSFAMFNLFPYSLMHFWVIAGNTLNKNRNFGDILNSAKDISISPR